MNCKYCGYYLYNSDGKYPVCGTMNEVSKIKDNDNDVTNNDLNNNTNNHLIDNNITNEEVFVENSDNLKREIIVFETKELTTYDIAENKFYITIPHDDVIDVKLVKRIDVDTLSKIKF